MSYGFTPTGTLPRAIKILLIVNVAVFVLDLVTKGQYLHPWLALDPYLTIHNFEAWRLISYLFVHDLGAPYFHILINMLLCIGATLLLASHNMSEVERLCDQVIMLRAGRVVSPGRGMLRP